MLGSVISVSSLLKVSIIIIATTIILFLSTLFTFASIVSHVIRQKTPKACESVFLYLLLTHQFPKFFSVRDFVARFDFLAEDTLSMYRLLKSKCHDCMKIFCCEIYIFLILLKLKEGVSLHSQQKVRCRQYFKYFLIG